MTQPVDAAPPRARASASALAFALEDPDTLDGRRLVRALWAELGRVYGDPGPCRFEPADVKGPGCAFVVARRDGVAIGCGALKPQGRGVVEIKRMYVAPEARKGGVARSILKRLEARAVELGYAVARLETGVRQPEAIELYQQAGYHRIEGFGRYVGDPLSVCFEKRLG
jgi:GNAT superfamily N-acetyltransferase